MVNWKLFVGVAALCAVSVFGRPKFGLPPPDVFKWLPEDAKEKLKSIHEDHSLKWEERRKMIDQVFDSLPVDVIAKMPLPPGFEKLPEDIQEQAKAIRTDKNLKWREKMEKVRELIQSLPEEQRRLIPPPRFGGPSPFGPRGFPPHPPPGFKEVLPSEVYQKLVEIHQNKDFTEEEKKAKIDETLKAVPKDTLEKLPLPPGFEKLPEDIQAQARTILTDLTMDFDARHQKLREFIHSLPEEQQKVLRPRHWGGFGPFGPRHHRGFPPHPPPEFKEILGEEIYNKLDAIHQEKGLNREERFKKIDALMATVPKETLEKLPLPPPFRQLPEEIQTQIRAIFHDFSIDSETKHKKIHDLIEALPENQRKILPFGGPGRHHFRGFPMGPPPDFKDILPADKWDQLVKIHNNEDLSWGDKKKQINDLMNSLPTETLLKLPLPPHLQKLSEENQQKIREIFADKTLSFDGKFRKARQFIKTLPEDQRKLARPSPPGFETLPAETKAQINAIFDNEDLDHHERFEKVREIIDALPDDVRAKLPSPFQ